MPDWLRRALVRGLTPDQLAAATNAIEAFLLPADRPDETTVIDFSRGEDRKRRKRLRDWLKLTPESVLSEQLLIEALEGRPPEQLGVEAPKGLLHHSRSLWAGNEMRVAALAAAATIAIAVWQWPSPPSKSPAVPPVNPEKVKPPPPPVPDISPSITPPEFNQISATELLPSGQDTSISASPTSRPTEQAVTTVSGISPSTPAPSIERSAPPRTVPIIRPPVVDTMGPFIIFFDFNRAVVAPEAQAILKNVAEAYFRATKSDRPAVMISIQAYTDAENDEYAIKLTQRMADSTKAYLAKLGVPSENIATRALGRSQPLPGTLQTIPEPANRRVEISIVNKPPPTAN